MIIMTNTNMGPYEDISVARDVRIETACCVDDQNTTNHDTQDDANKNKQTNKLTPWP
jgi:hypothetical protein